MPAVSVLIPCHNHAALLDQAVASALAQTAVQAGLPLEIIIVNDGSTDATGEVAEAWRLREPERIVVLHQRRRGQAQAREAALGRATGEFLVLLDADDLLESTMLAELVPALEAQPTAAAVIGQALLVAADGRRVLRPFAQAEVRPWPAMLEYNPYGALAACLLRASAVRAVGGLTVPGTPGCEDWDLWVRLARAGWPVVTHPAVCARYRQGESNYSRQPLVMLRAELELLDRVAASPAPASATDAIGAAPLPLPEPAAWARLRNGRVFHALGLALGHMPAGAGDGSIFTQLTAELVPGPFDESFCCMLAGWGLQFARDGRQAASVHPDAPLPAPDAAADFNPALADGLTRLMPILDEQLLRCGLAPEARRSLCARLAASLGNSAAPPPLLRRLMRRILRRRFFGRVGVVVA